MSNPTLTVTQAYRRLYRAALRAVHHSTPARYQIRDIIRPAFRHDTSSTLNARRVDNTERFLRRAEESNGLEHKILRNILHSRYWERVGDVERVPAWMRGNNDVSVELRRERYAPLHATVVMLNESMDLCLRS